MSDSRSAAATTRPAGFKGLADTPLQSGPSKAYSVLTTGELDDGGAPRGRLSAADRRIERDFLLHLMTSKEPHAQSHPAAEAVATGRQQQLAQVSAAAPGAGCAHALLRILFSAAASLLLVFGPGKLLR